MLKITATVEGEEILKRAFNRVTEKIEDLTDVWKAVQPVFFAIEQDQFQSEGAKGLSGRWKPLSPKYAAIKRKLYGRFLDDINIRTERLYKSLTRAGADDAVFEAGKQEMAIGTSTPYARNVQKARPIIDLSEPQKRLIQKAIQKALLKEIRPAGFVMTEENYKDFG